MANKNGAEKAPLQKLTLEQQEAIVEEYLGCHPKYFFYEGADKIKIDVYRIAMDGYIFTGLKGSVKL